jgi:transcriptional regulator with XRE-family HTH domain
MKPDSTHDQHPLARWIGRHSTQADFARDVGCSESHLANLIAGRKRPSINLLDRIIARTKGRVGIAAFTTMEAAE